MLAGDHHERKGIKLDRNLGRQDKGLNPGGAIRRGNTGWQAAVVVTIAAAYGRKL